jgi:hypothetical protein
VDCGYGNCIRDTQFHHTLYTRREKSASLLCRSHYTKTTVSSSHSSFSVCHSSKHITTQTTATFIAVADSLFGTHDVSLLQVASSESPNCWANPLVTPWISAAPSWGQNDEIPNHLLPKFQMGHNSPTMLVGNVIHLQWYYYYYGSTTLCWTLAAFSVS